MASKEQMKFTLDFVAKTAGLKDSAAMSAKLSDALEDNDDAATQLAKAMSIAADAIEADLKETTEYAERLGNALGPELRAKLGAGGVDDLAGRFRQAGVSIQDAEQNIDQLAAGVQRLDGLSDKAAVSMNKLDGRDQSGSVRANFLGNAAQEIPGVTGAMGPLNMAIGQFVEYGAEGNINMRNLAATAGPMLGVAVAMELVAKYQREVAAVKAWKKGEVESFTKSLKAGANVAEDFRDRLLEAGKIEFNLNRMFGGDVLDDMQRAGVSFDQFFAAVDGGEDGIQKLVDALRAAGVEGGDLAAIMMAASAQQDNLTQARETYAALQEVGLAATDAEIAAARRQKIANDYVTESIEAKKKAAEDDIDTMYDHEKAVLDSDQAYQDYLEALKEANEAANDANTTDEERSEIMRDLRGDQMSITEGLYDQAAAFAVDQGASEGSRAAYMLQRDALEEMKSKYPLLADEIQKYIDKLNSIPGVKNTNVSVTYAGGAGGTGADGTGASGDTGNLGGGVRPGGIESVSPSRGSGVSVTVNISGPVMGGDQMVVDMITRAVNDGVRAAWMAV